MQESMGRDINKAISLKKRGTKMSCGILGKEPTVKAFVLMWEQKAFKPLAKCLIW